MRRRKSTIKIKFGSKKERKDFDLFMRGDLGQTVAYATILMGGLTCLGMSVGVAMFTRSHRDHPWPLFLTGLFMSGLSVGIFWLRRYSRRLIPEDQLHDRLNLDDRSLNRVMQEHQVQPRLVVNGKSYYAPADFGDVSTLLRASAPSDAVETLLHPALPQPEADLQLTQLLRADASEKPAPDLTRFQIKENEPQVERMRAGSE